MPNFGVLWLRPSCLWRTTTPPSQEVVRQAATPRCLAAGGGEGGRLGEIFHGGAERVGSPSPMGIHPQAIPAGGSVHGGSLVGGGGEGEGGPVGGEGEGGRLGLFSSPLPGLFSSPHPGLFSPPPWYSRPDYRSDCRSRRWGDTRARRRYARPGGVGMGGGRAAAAVPPSRALTSPSRFSSNQPVSLRGGGGGSALGRRVRARAARDLFREGMRWVG